MCGFLFAVSSAGPWDPVRFNAARDALAHRGPDAADSAFLDHHTVALGHRRLSILDLSAAANQPMRQDALWVVYNGEIYNYPELRKELEQRGCVFRTHTDTEVLLHGYRVWKDGLCEKLRGMFAFALWDDETETLYAGRDHLGQKPFYFASVDGRFVAASEIKAITALLGRRFPMRRESLLEFLVCDYVPEPFTWYEGIQSLLPGHYLKLKRRSGSWAWGTAEYWSFRPDPHPRPIRPEQAREEMGRLIEREVRAHLQSDVEVGAFLSGGVDSSCVATVAGAALNHPLKTFSIGFGSADEDELPLARQTAARIGARHFERTVRMEELRQALDRVLTVFDQPFGDSSLAPTYEVSELAAEQVKVVITGDGGDEVFGGYWHYHKYLTLPEWSFSSWPALRHSWAARWAGLAAWQARLNFGHQVMTERNARRVLAPALAGALRDHDPCWQFRAHWRPELDPFRRAQWLDIKCYLPGDILVKVDRCSMRHSLETRPPFLAAGLLEYMLNLPAEVKNPGGEFKGLFRDWLRNRVPDGVLHAPKRGFGITDALWSDFLADERVERAMRAGVERGLFSADAMELSRRNPGLAWRMIQITQALESGLFAG
jgi:asparagine synthase (glutamine-hydrolysing)